MGTLIGYTVQKITKNWIPLADDVGRRPLLKMVLSYLMFSCTGNVFEILARKGEVYAARSQTDDITEATDFVNEKAKTAAHVRERSIVFKKRLRHVAYQYPEHLNSSFTNIVQYIGQEN